MGFGFRDPDRDGGGACGFQIVQRLLCEDITKALQGGGKGQGGDGVCVCEMV